MNKLSRLQQGKASYITEHKTSAEHTNTKVLPEILISKDFRLRKGESMIAEK